MVGQCCCVTSCRSRSHNPSGLKVDNGTRFFAFPTWKKHGGEQAEGVTRRRRTAWLAAVRRGRGLTFGHIPRSMKVCSLHFQSGKPAYEMFESHPDWAPSLHLGPREDHPLEKDAEEMLSMVDETEPLQDYTEEPAGNHTEELAGIHTEEPAGIHTEEPAGIHIEPEPASIIVELTEEVAGWAEGEHVLKKLSECDFCSYRRGEINRLLSENRELKCALAKRNMDEESLKEDDAKVKYYTGLPSFGLLMGLLSTVMPYLPMSFRTLSQFQMVFLTLMRLTLNLPLQHLAYLFHVDRRGAATVFNTTLRVLHTQLSPLVRWPDRDVLCHTMPHQFVEAFGDRVAVILDCLEIPTERASDLKAFSHNKQSDNKNTMKYHIGITTHGSISFISKGWRGYVNDKYVTENSGLLDHLLPGDLVLADCSGDVRAGGGMMCAEVTKPALEDGLCGLEAKGVGETQPIAHLRSHVESLMGTVRDKYTILCGPIPNKRLLACAGEDLTFLDKIVSVCCVLTNMCSSVVDPTCCTELDF